MKLCKKLLFCLLPVLLCAVLLTPCAFAATSDSLEIDLHTDKTAYEKEEPITVSFTVSNTGKTAVDQVTLESGVPAGYQLDTGCETTKHWDTLSAGETAALTFSCTPQAAEIKPSAEPEVKPEPTAAVPAETGKEDDVQKKGGIFLWLLLLVILIAVICFVVIKKKAGKKVLSLLLCTVLLSSLFAQIPLRAKALEGESLLKELTVETEITVDGKPVTLTGTVRYLPPAAPESTCTVSFETNGGTPIKAQTLPEGAKAVRPSDPTRTGHWFGGWYTDAQCTKAYDFAKPVTHSMTLYAKWNPQQETTPEVKPDVKPDVPADAVHAAFVLGIDSAFVDNAASFQPVALQKGQRVTRPEDPRCAYATFTGWYQNMDQAAAFDFSTPIQEDTHIYAGWELISTDSDGDGLPDPLENKNHTDPQKADTDGDGLNDLVELQIGIDPTKPDTDSDGLPDAEEDSDGDTLPNGQEIELGTNPARQDSDFDALTDAQETGTYHTDPQKEDTDDDGALDFWEITNGFDPTKADVSFIVTDHTQPLGDAVTTSASVTVDLPGQYADTLDIQRVSPASNPLVRATLPGYMGPAYDFQTEGEFTEAAITFTYDPARFGALSESFQPRIYYLNEELGLYQELENQQVSEGSVSVTVTHFSTYLLLNKVEFDKVWNQEIKLPIESESGSGNIDVAFVVDCSGSMRHDDRMPTAKTALHTFLGALTEKDRAALISFTKKATVRSGLTSDIAAVDGLVDSLEPHGKTAMYTGLDAALTMLTDPAVQYGYKMIIVLTDGRDEPRTHYEDEYAPLVQKAADNNVVIYTIGASPSVSADELETIATQTGGAYYEASVTDGITDAFEQIQGNTVDVATDTNKDGIPDYYNQLILEGKLPMADQFKGIDFSQNPDYDGDGLLNGDELQITTIGKKVHVIMQSNPTLEHSDNDGIPDGVEKRQGSDPLIYSVNKDDAYFLMQNVQYLAACQRDNMVSGSCVELNCALSGVWNKDQIYAQNYVNYFKNNSMRDYLKQVSFEAARNAMLETVLQVLDFHDAIQEGGGDIVELTTEGLALIDSIRDTEDEEALSHLYLYFNNFMDHVAENAPNLELQVHVQAMKNSKKVQSFLSKADNTISKVSDGVSVVVSVLEVADTVNTFSSMTANHMALDQNMDILARIITSSSDDDARNAAKDIANKLAGNYAEEVKAVAHQVQGMAVQFAIGKLAESIPYIQAALVTIHAADWIFGISDMLEALFTMNSYVELADGARRAFLIVADENSDFYQARSFENSCDQMLIRLLTHSAQLRIYGEDAYYDFMTTQTLGWFADRYQMRNQIGWIFLQVKEKLDLLHITVNKASQAVLDNYPYPA